MWLVYRFQGLDLAIELSFLLQAYRGHKEMAVLLLQNGIDTTIKNHRGQLGNIHSMFCLQQYFLMLN